MSLFSSIRKSPGEQYLIFALIFMAICFHIATLRPGHQWEGDFALYTIHARNMVDDRPYTDTGFIVHPKRAFLSPEGYPPVFPAFISPVYKFMGLDVHAIKIANLTAFAIFLLLFQHYVRKRLRLPVSRIAVVAAVAFSPWFWIAKDRILPDFVFILLVFCVILLVDSTYTPGRSSRHRYLLAIFTGIVAYLAYGTRSIGLVLVPAIWLTDLLRLKLISRYTLIITAVFAMGYFAQNSALNTDKSYTDIFKTTLKKDESEQRIGELKNKEIQPASFDVKPLIRSLVWSFNRNSAYYHRNMSDYWSSNISLTADKAIYVIMGLLAITGFLAFALRNPSTGDCLAFAYTGLLLIVPFTQSRYLLPLIPLYLLYIFHGLETITRNRTLFSRPAGSYSILGLLLVISLFYTGSYSTQNFDSLANNVDKKESREMFDFIRENTPRESVLISFKPRLLALFTDRRSSIYAARDTPEDHLDYFEKIGATHIVTTKKDSGIYENREFTNWISNRTDLFELVFVNMDFSVYRVR